MKRWALLFAGDTLTEILLWPFDEAGACGLRDGTGVDRILPLTQSKVTASETLSQQKPQNLL